MISPRHSSRRCMHTRSSRTARTTFEAAKQVLPRSCCRWFRLLQLKLGWNLATLGARPCNGSVPSWDRRKAKCAHRRSGRSSKDSWPTLAWRAGHVFCWWGRVLQSSRLLPGARSRVALLMKFVRADAAPGRYVSTVMFDSGFVPRQSARPAGTMRRAPAGCRI